MRLLTSSLFILVLLLMHGASFAGQAPVKPPGPRQALQVFNQLIGRWKGTGVPFGSREVKQRGFWVESMNWYWEFKGKDAWIIVDFDEGKHFKSGQVRYLPESKQFQLQLKTNGNKAMAFTGKLQNKRLTLSRKEPATGQTQMLVIRLLHPNRFLYTYSVLPKGKTLVERVYQVGATRKGVRFAAGSNQPECIVSGGLGTSKVSYKGKTYYVCCSGCRNEFYENPEMYVKEFERKNKK